MVNINIEGDLQELALMFMEAKSRYLPIGLSARKAKRITQCLNG